MEEPNKQRTTVDDIVEKFLTCNIGIIMAGITGGDTERQMMFFSNSIAF